MDKIKIGILGVGHLGRFHTQNYLSIPEAEIVGIYDADFARSQAVASELNVPVYKNLVDLLDKIEAASVVVTTSAHHQIATACLENGIHCLVEKPITSTLVEADELIELAGEKNLILQVGHIERFNPALMALNGFELSPMFIESHRLASFNPRGTDVAVVLDLMIHDIDIILHLVKSPVTEIDASGVAVITRAVDIANARIKFANGCVANVTASRISQKAMRKMRLFQKNCYIGVDFLQKYSELYQLVDANDFQPQTNQIPIEFGQVNQFQTPKKIVYERRQVEEANALKMELESFLHAVRSGEKPAVSGEDGREALRVAIEITGLIEKQVKKLI
ncbi:MAG: Gfo/Idh/MocA family oxidoreductase [Calditrichaeota bacterium]|nr:Gfo/Idh/MocA family oxidoreductase [Calditrichota bacterium]